MDLNPDNPFGDLMSKAVKLKGHQQAQLRTRFDGWPQYFQHSMFMQESVTSMREKDFPERIEGAEAMKAAGNAHFTKGDLEEAVAEYEKALSVFKYAENTDPGWKKKGIEDKDIRVVDFKCDHTEEQARLVSLKISCYQNLAVCKFKLKEYATCIRACDDALELDPKNIKALYRRALALTTPASSGAVEFEQALSDLHRAYNIDPENREVRKMYRELREQKNRQKQLDKKTFTGMFNRGEVYENADMSVKIDENARESKFMQEVEEAENLARMCEAKGHIEYAKEIRGKIDQVKVERTRRRKQVDFFHPTPEMIEDAKAQGIDLTDPQVQAMLSQMQEDEKRKERDPDYKGIGNPDSADVESIEAVLKSMNNAQIAQMLNREGIDYHKITDREQFMETARQVLRTKLAAETKKDSNKYFKTVCLFGLGWFFVRLYMSGGLGFLFRAITGSTKPSLLEQAVEEDDFFDV